MVRTSRLYRLSQRYNKSNTGIYQGDALAILTNIGSPKSGKAENHFEKFFSNTFFTTFQLQKSIYLYE